MKTQPQFAVRRVVLAGGGHSHALLLKNLSMRPWLGVHFTLVSESSLSPYSGMLPSYIAGSDSLQASHVDLWRLCAASGVTFVKARILGLDLRRKALKLADRPDLSWDCLSINTGCLPAFPDLPGFATWAVGIKPIAPFLQKLTAFESAWRANPQQNHAIAVIGGGIAGVELILALHARFLLLGNQQPHLTLYQDQPLLVPQLSARARGILEQALARAGVKVHRQAQLSALDSKFIYTKDARPQSCSLCILATHAAAPAWPKEAGLETDAHGFISVSDTLQSLTHPDIFVAGDIAHFVKQPLAKAGVYAVRASKPLARNLRLHLQGKPCKPYRPQKDFLKLIGTSDGRALAIRNRLCAYGPIWLNLKRAIDGKFMRMLQSFSVAESASAKKLFFTKLCLRPPYKVASLERQALQRHSEIRCRGCAAKWHEQILEELVGNSREDAAQLNLPTGGIVVQSLDYMPALVDDPFVFGRILVNHAFNDIYAMGARPHSCLSLLLLPLAADPIVAALGRQLIAGLKHQLNILGGIPLVGGHTAEAAVLSAGLSCNGVLDAGQTSWQKGGLQAGDALILTKGLGSGVIFAASMRLQAEAAHIDSAIEAMLCSHASAVAIAKAFSIHAATDITGFGLWGHLAQMAQASQRKITLDISKIPALPGAAHYLELGLRSSLAAQNVAMAERDKGLFVELVELKGAPASEQTKNTAPYHLLFDPQTSGPLLLALPADQAPALLNELHKHGYSEAAIIGVTAST